MLHAIKAQYKSWLFHIQQKQTKTSYKTTKTKTTNLKMYVSSVYGYGLAAPAWGYSSWGYAPACGLGRWW